MNPMTIVLLALVTLALSSSVLNFILAFRARSSPPQTSPDYRLSALQPRAAQLLEEHTRRAAQEWEKSLQFLKEDAERAAQVPAGVKLYPSVMSPSAWDFSAENNLKPQPSQQGGPYPTWETSITLPAEIQELVIRGKATVTLQAGTHPARLLVFSSFTGPSGGTTAEKTPKAGRIPSTTSGSGAVFGSTPSEPQAPEQAGSSPGRTHTHDLVDCTYQDHNASTGWRHRICAAATCSYQEYYAG